MGRLRHLSLASEVAGNSDMQKTQHGAVMVSGGKVRATGYNHCRKWIDGSVTSFSLHAEIHALHGLQQCVLWKGWKGWEGEEI